MGLVSSFDTNNDHINSASDSGKLIIDLSTFRIGGTPLGKEAWDGDFFSQALAKEAILANESAGYELAAEDGSLISAFITLARFQGSFIIKDQLTAITQKTNKEEILSLFGEPYWTDLDDDEIILFYEYQEGSIELQFEFLNGQELTYITLIKNGVLSDPTQRKSYGVTKPWPPA